jgi:hypothetical protein
MTKASSCCLSFVLRQYHKTKQEDPAFAARIAPPPLPASPLASKGKPKPATQTVLLFDGVIGRGSEPNSKK